MAAVAPESRLMPRLKSEGIRELVKDADTEVVGHTFDLRLLEMRLLGFGRQLSDILLFSSMALNLLDVCTSGSDLYLRILTNDSSFPPTAMDDNIRSA